MKTRLWLLLSLASIAAWVPLAPVSAATLKEVPAPLQIDFAAPVLAGETAADMEDVLETATEQLPDQQVKKPESLAPAATELVPSATPKATKPEKPPKKAKPGKKKDQGPTSALIRSSEMQSPQSAPPDPNTFLNGLQGNYETDLFTGAAAYIYPLVVPEGRVGVQPALSLSYSSLDRNLSSIAGYGWSLPLSAISRSSAKGVDHLYSDDRFTATIFGAAEELIVIDSADHLYAPQVEGSFTEYRYDPGDDAWTATDTRGTKFTFGMTAASRQADPDDAGRVRQWLLEKVEDVNGNFITFTYSHDAGQVYPDTIRYTGHGNEVGNYEVKFLLENKPVPAASYADGFRVETKKRLAQIDFFSYHNPTPELIRSYDLTYADTTSVVDHLQSITLKNGSASLPPTVFQYYNDDDAPVTGEAVQPGNLLKQITLPSGGTIDLVYRSSTAFRTAGGGIANPDLSFDLPLLRKVTTTDPVTGLISATTYDYEGGHYFFDQGNAFTRAFAGFAKVKTTDPAGNITITRFHQSQFAPDNPASAALGESGDHFAKKGRIWRTETYDNQGILYAVAIRTWNKTALSDEDPENDRFLVTLGKQVNIAFDGKATGRAAATEYVYDSATGNLTTETDLGEVTLTDNSIDQGNKYDGDGSYTDTGTDKLTTVIEYAQNAAKHVLALPKRTETKDQGNITTAEEKTYYDDLAFGQVDKGNPTKAETLVTTTPSAQYITTQAAYNSYGLMTSLTDARGHVTSFTYDALNLFPAMVTNAKGHIISTSYDYRFGVPAEITDPNGFKTKHTYDSLGLLVKTEVTDPANPTQLLTEADYTYDLATFPITLTSTAFANNNDTANTPIAILSKTYLDGFARVIQTRSEWEGIDTYLVAGTVYDNRGNVKKQLLPQFGIGSGFDAAFNESKPGALSTFDAIGRVIATTTPFGAGTATTTVSYDRWTKTVTDARDFKQDYGYDARQNLVQVKEYLAAGAGAAPAGTTTYQYDANQNLIRITDALGNIKTLAYDLLGRKLAEDDFHAVNDTTYSHWTYSYDSNGNLTSVTDAKNQTTTATYDELDRPLTEDFTGQAGVEVTYTYDTAPNGKGLPATIATAKNAAPVITKAFEYDLRRNITKETRAINSVSYITQFEYDLTGQPKRIVYPDTAHTEALYFYNNAGQLEKVQKKQDATTADLVTNLDYAPTGALKTIAYANGVTTTQTYDINHNYFLTHKETVKGSAKLQDISYSFDAAGNITQITDASQTDAAKTVAYTYDGLARLTAAAATNAANGQNYSHTFAYDILGNITNKSDVGAYIYAQTNYANPHAVTGAGGKTYTYDENGNLTTDGTWTNTWDNKDRLLSTAKTGTTVSFAYDEGGTRVIKQNSASGKQTIYVSDLLDIEAGTEKIVFYANGLKLATLSQPGASSGTECTVPPSGDWTVTADCTVSSFQTAPGKVIVNPGVTLTIASSGVLNLDLAAKGLLVNDTGGVSVQAGGHIAQTGRLTAQQTISLIFHHTDHLSGASVDTDSSGNVVQLTDYYPYGDSRIETATGVFHNDYTYTGKERDEDTALLYYEARYYDSHLGRFISRDPWNGDIADPQSFNKYAYARNNPLNYVDPDGRAAVSNFATWHNKILSQKDKTGMGNVCGAMSLLIAFNYYSNISNITPAFVKDATTVIAAIKSLYTYVGKSYTVAMSGAEMKNIVLNKSGWRWKTALIRSSSVQTSVTASYTQLTTDLTNQRLVIALMKANSIFAPKPQTTDIEKYRHFIVVYSADSSTVKYADPWDGLLKSVTKTTFLNGWIGARYFLTVKPT